MHIKIILVAFLIGATFSAICQENKRKSDRSEYTAQESEMLKQKQDYILQAIQQYQKDNPGDSFLELSKEEQETYLTEKIMELRGLQQTAPESPSHLNRKKE